jgi:hypothetical protein
MSLFRELGADPFLLKGHLRVDKGEKTPIDFSSTRGKNGLWLYYPR